MLERIWTHIQTYTIIALVYSPALVMMWMSGNSTQSIDFGPQSTATQEASIETYSIHIDIEEEGSMEEEPAKEAESMKEIVPKQIKSPKNSSIPKALKKEEKKIQPLEPKDNAVEKLQLQKKQITAKSRLFSKAKKEKTVRKRTRRGSARCTPNPNRRIQERSSNQYTLQKKLVHGYLGSIKNMQKLAKAYWYKGKRGEGVLLQSIPCKSPLRNMGLRPKDIIVSINGKKVTNNLDLMGSYIQLKSKKKIDIVLKRQSRPLTLQYEIVKKLKKG